MYFLTDGIRKRWLDKSERQHLYQIYISLWRILELKKSLWVICKVLRLFVNPLTADDKYSLLNRGYLLQHFQMDLSQKRKIFSGFFFSFSRFSEFWTFSKKRWPSYLMYFWADGLRKTWLDKCLSDRQNFRTVF